MIPLRHTDRFDRARAPALAAVLLLALASPAPASDESSLIEETPAKSAEEDEGSIERALKEEAPPDPPFFPRLKGLLSELPPVLRDTELDLQIRNFYFRRRRTDNRDLEALTTGGALRYRSGWLFDHLQLGATLFTSQKLHGPDRRDGTLLLRPRQRSYTVVGESFVRARLLGSELTLYRHGLDLPYLNGNDSRMTPNTFEGFTALGRYRRVGYAVGHLLQIKRRNDDNFVSFSEAAGVQRASSHGLSFVGFRIEPLPNLVVGGINQYVKDTLNTLYGEAEWHHQDEAGWGVRVATQFTSQMSVGDDRLTGDSFDTWVWGAKLGGSWADAVLGIAVSITDDDQRIRNPFGSYPGYLGMMERNFNDANEKAWGIGASYYFGLIGLPDLSLVVRYVEGYDRQRAQTGEDLGDRRELNATADYRLRRGLLRGLWLRARFGWGQVDGARRDSLEARIIVRYDLRLL